MTDSDKELDVIIDQLPINTGNSKIDTEFKESAKKILTRLIEKKVREARVDGMFAIVKLGNDGYHNRDDYPPFQLAAWDDRNKWNAYLEKIAKEQEAQLQDNQAKDRNE